MYKHRSHLSPKSATLPTECKKPLLPFLNLYSIQLFSHKTFQSLVKTFQQVSSRCALKNENG